MCNDLNNVNNAIFPYVILWLILKYNMVYKKGGKNTASLKKISLVEEFLGWLAYELD